MTFLGTLTGDEASQFFDHVGTIDGALWSGLFAGFTQIDFGGSSTNNSMLFLQPAVSKNRFISGLSTAAADDPRATYFPLKINGTPTTARAGIAFPGNDWVAFPDGDQYLANIGGTSQLLNELAALRQKHLAAVASLLEAITDDRVERYLPPVQLPELTRCSVIPRPARRVPAAVVPQRALAEPQRRRDPGAIYQPRGGY